MHLAMTLSVFHSVYHEVWPSVFSCSTRGYEVLSHASYGKVQHSVSVKEAHRLCQNQPRESCLKSWTLRVSLMNHRGHFFSPSK